MLSTIQRRMPSPYVFGPHSPVANQAGGSIASAPTYPGADSGGGGGGGGMLSMFQRSVSKERAMNAMRAATFAANAPEPVYSGAAAAPMPADPSYGRSGRPPGAAATSPVAPAGGDAGEYGRSGRPPAGVTPATMPTTAAAPAGASVGGAGIPGPAAIDRNSVARRKAYIAAKMAEANAEDFGDGPNVFARAGEAEAESARKTRAVESEAGERDARAGLVGAQARGVDAYTAQGLPAEVARTQTATRGMEDEIADRQATRPGRVESQRLANSRYATESPLLAAEGRARVKGLETQNSLGEQMIAPTVAGANARVEGEKDRVRDSANLNKQQGELLRAQEGFVKQKIEAAQPQQPAVDPLTAINAEKERYSLAKQMAQEEYEGQHGLFGTGLMRGMFSGYRPLSQIIDEKMAKIPRAGGSGGGDNHPDGATGMHNGRPVVKRNGEWVYTDGK